jgi:glycosyltransferase involved in cell wall biosynthesis
MKSYPGDDKVKELVFSGKWDKARSLLESVLEINENAGVLNDLALVVTRFGERDRAFDMIDRAASQPDADVRVRMNRFYISELAEFNENRGEKALERVVETRRGDDNLKPKLSVIMRTYNRPALIEYAVKSVLDQKYKDFELIIVNDGGERGTEQTLDRVWDKRMVYAYALHSGPSGAFNVGLRLSRGDYIGFLDDDDIVYPEGFDRLANWLDFHPQCNAVYSDLKVSWLSGTSQEVLKSAENITGPFSQERVWRGFYILNLMSLVFRREMLNMVPGFLEGLKSAVDWEFFLSLNRYYNFDYASGIAGEMRYREGLPQIGKRSIIDRNHQRNLILYYHGMSPFYSFGLTGRGISAKFFSALERLLNEHSELTPGLELRKLFNEPEYALFYKLGSELEKEGRKKEARAAYLAAAKIDSTQPKIWGKLTGSFFR